MTTHAKATNVLPELKAVKVLRLEPGDVLVCEYAGQLTVQEAELLKKEVGDQFPGHKVVVVSGGLQLSRLILESELG